jgi:tetratricopeptide (TPR) repeat protein
MIHKKIFVRMFVILFIVSIVIFVVGCDNETAANDKGTEKSLSDANLSFEAKKIREGLDLFESANYKGAIELCDEISALNLNSVSEYKLRGEYFVKIGEYYYDIMSYDKGKELFDLAIRDYDSTIQLAPNDVDSYINRGDFYCKHGDQDLAIKDYDKVLELDPNNVDAYIGRGNAYNNIRHLAQRDLNKAIEINPNDFKAYMARSIIYLNIGQNDLALEDANRAVELNPNNPDVYNNRGFIHHDLKQYDLSLQDYNKALELDPKNFNLLAREFPRLYRRWDESRIDNRHFFAKIKLLENKE